MEKAEITDALAIRRKKLHFRACHRGMKEMDIILSRFSEKILPELTEAELDAYEELLALPDADLFAWLSGQKPPPDMQKKPLLAALLARLLQMDYMNE